MKRLTLALLLALTASAVYAYTCRTHTIFTADGKMITCTTCCGSDGANCTTTCF